MDANKVFNVVLADDDPDDRMIFEKAFQEIPEQVDLCLVKDGDELMDLLHGPDASMPDMVFLDLNMPCKNGFECLEEIKASAEISGIFIVVCSTSSNYAELEETFQKGANLFIRKVNSFSELKALLHKILTLDLEEYMTNRLKERYLMKA